MYSLPVHTSVGLIDQCGAKVTRKSGASFAPSAVNRLKYTSHTPSRRSCQTIAYCDSSSFQRMSAPHASPGARVSSSGSATGTPLGASCWKYTSDVLPV